MTAIGRTLGSVLRRLGRSPGFTVVSVLTLALGIGANTAIFSVVEGVLLRPLPYAAADRLVGLWHSAPGIGIPEFEQSVTSYTLYREANRTFDDIALVDELTFNLTGSGRPERVLCARASASLFHVLGVQPALGRPIGTEDERQRARVVLLSDEMWRTRFGSAPDVVGRTIRLDGDPWEVIGVMPRDFAFPERGTRLWLPFPIDPADLGRANFSYDAIGLLRQGVSIEQANADLNELLVQMPDRYPGEITAGMLENAAMRAFVRPMRDDVVGDVSSILWILLGSVGLVLLIACANVANLFLVRAEGRQREVAVRTALGAGVGDLARYFLGESLWLAGAGCVLGVGLAQVGLRFLVALSPIEIPRIQEVGLNATVLAYAVGVSLLVGLALGVLPILRYARPTLATSLKEGGRGGSTSRATHRARKLLVATQVALALVLLVGSGLMFRSFRALREVDPGFVGDRVLTLRVSLPEARYASDREAASFYTNLLERLSGLPGVEAVGAVSNLPMTDGQSNNAAVLEDFPLAQDELPPIVRTNYASPGYFETIGIPLLEGRTLERADHETPTGVAIVSRSFARRFWPEESAIGKRVSPDLIDEHPEWYTIVGVVGDVRDDRLADDPPPMIYYPVVGLPESEDPADTAWTVRTMSVVLRTQGEPLALAPEIPRIVWELDADLPIANLRPAGAIVRESMAPVAFTMLLLGIAAAVALVLGTVGIYGVVSYVVAQRTREIGVRMALGAQRGAVRGMVVRGALAVAAAGVVVGLAGAFVLSRLLGSVLFGVSATDPWTFGATVALLLGVTVLASVLPAHRAATVEPTVALRYE